jgi:hypothetical protein
MSAETIFAFENLQKAKQVAIRAREALQKDERKLQSLMDVDEESMCRQAVQQAQDLVLGNVAVSLVKGTLIRKKITDVYIVVHRARDPDNHGRLGKPRIFEVATGTTSTSVLYFSREELRAGNIRLKQHDHDAVFAVGAFASRELHLRSDGLGSQSTWGAREMFLHHERFRTACHELGRVVII